MKKPILGRVACPVCVFDDAEVKADKNGHAYIHCVDCNAQTFTRSDYRDKKLRARMRPVTVTVTGTAPEPVPAPEPAAEPLAPPAPAKIDQTKNPAPAGDKPKRASWFSPVLAGGEK